MKDLLRIRNMALIWLALIGFFVSLSGSAMAAEPTTLRMGLIPADDAERMLRSYKTVQGYLQDKLKMKVDLKVTQDYTAAIEAMRAKHIDVAWFGPFSYVLAAKIAGAEAIVRGIRRGTNMSTYKSLIIAKKDSPIDSIAGLKGRTFAFVDPASSSGNLFPRALLKSNGLDPEKDFKSYNYAGSHNAVGLAVYYGKVDAGAIADTTFGAMVKEGKLDEAKLKIVAASPPIPGSPIVVRKDLSEGFKKKIQRAFLEMDAQTIHKVDGWGDIASYEATSDQDYEFVRKTAEILNLKLGKK